MKDRMAQAIVALRARLNESAVLKVVNRIEINATPAEVFYWLEEPDRAKQWITSVTKSEIIKETPNKVGTTSREYIEENGRGLEMEGVVTEFVALKALCERQPES